MDCVFCAVNNKVRTYARGKLMSDHKDLGKSFASGHELLTLAGRGSRGTRGGGGDAAGQERRCERHHRTHNNQTSAPMYTTTTEGGATKHRESFLQSCIKTAGG